MTFACATAAEQRAARRAGVRSALVGLGARNGVPEGPVVSFGLTGALRDGLAPGTVVDATRIVDVEGAVLWEGGPVPSGADGITLPGLVIVREGHASPYLLRHEQVHVRQWRRAPRWSPRRHRCARPCRHRRLRPSPRSSRRRRRCG